MIRADEGSLNGVEQKVHATELVVRSYTSLGIAGFFNTFISMPPNKRGVCIARVKDLPLWGKSEGVLPPYDRTFRNICCGDQAFPLLLVEVFHPESKTFLCILERVETMKELAGGRFESSSGIRGWIFSRIDQPEAVENLSSPFFAHKPSRVFRQQQRVEFWDTQSGILPAQCGEGGSEIGIRRRGSSV